MTRLSLAVLAAIIAAGVSAQDLDVDVEADGYGDSMEQVEEKIEQFTREILERELEEYEARHRTDGFGENVFGGGYGGADPFGANPFGAATIPGGQFHSMISPDMQKFMRVELPEILEEIEELKIDVTTILEPEERAELAREQDRLLRFAREFRDIHRELPEMADDVLERHELEREAEELAESMEDVEDKGRKDNLERELRSVLDEAFEISIRIREREADQIHEELVEIRTLLEKRRKNKEAIIERRLAELLEGVDPYEW